MGNVIDFLERVGRDASLRHASGSVLDEALDADTLDASLRNALIAKDGDALRDLLGLDVFFGSQMPDGPDHEEEEEDPEDDDTDGDEDEARPGKSRRSSGLSH